MKKRFGVILALLSVLSVGLLVQPAYGKYAAKIHVGSLEVRIETKAKPNLVDGKEFNLYIFLLRATHGVTEVVFDFYENHPEMRSRWGFEVGKNQEGAEEKDKVRLHPRGRTAYVLSDSEICASSCEGMFKDCYFLRRVTFQNFDTTGVESMREMFSGCFELQRLDLSKFNTSSVLDMHRMFYGCRELKQIYVSEKWSTESVTSGEEMFQNCIALKGGKGTKYSFTQTSYLFARIDETGAKGYLTRMP